MGIFYKFKHKDDIHRNGTSLEDCIVKMFASAGMEPYRDGNKFSAVVLGKHYVFIVTISCMEGNELCVYVRFPETVRKDVASAVNYEVKRLGKEAVETLPEAQVSLLEKGDGYHIIVKTVKKIEELSDNTLDEIQNLMNHSVDILDGKNFDSLFSAIFGYKSYEEATKMPVEYTGGYRGTVKFKDGYLQDLDDVPNLSDSRFAGRLMGYAVNIIAKKGNDEVLGLAIETSIETFDNYIQMAYDIANEEERDLMRKLRSLVKAKNEGEINEDDFLQGKMEGVVISNGNPWDLLYQDGITNDTDISEEEKLYKRLCAPQNKDRPYEQRDLGEGMTLVNQTIGEYWKPRYLMDKEARCAYEFMSIDEVLQIVTDEDIDWDNMKGLPQDAFDRAKAHSFHFPGHVYQYKNGVAEVEWQLNPDGMYYRDEDGFGMTDDEEINLYGAIDRKGKVVKKFTLKR